MRLPLSSREAEFIVGSSSCAYIFVETPVATSRYESKVRGHSSPLRCRGLVNKFDQYNRFIRCTRDVNPSFAVVPTSDLHTYGVRRATQFLIDFRRADARQILILPFVPSSLIFPPTINHVVLRFERDVLGGDAISSSKNNVAE